MDDGFEALIDQLITSSSTVSDLLSGLGSTPGGIPVETPGLTARLDKEFFPTLPGRLFARLVLLPGKAWAVYMVLRLRSRLDKRQTVPLTSTYLRRFGITRRQKEQALASLEAAHLITVERSNGKNPQVALRAEDVPWVK